MRKALIILIVLLGIFLAIGCAGNKQVTQNETGTPEQAVTSNEVVTPTGEKATVTQNVTEKQNVTASQNITEKQNVTAIQNVTEKSKIKEYTLEELAKYNGKNGTAYVAYQDQVYNVSDSNVWKNGSHNGCNAGTDLTGKMNKTPHGDKILKGYPVVGTLKK